jgi:LysM repeat protein
MYWSGEDDSSGMVKKRVVRVAWCRVFVLLLGLWLILGPWQGVLAQAGVTHTVQAGENLFRIAIYYGTTVDAIMSANALSSVYIYVGQVLTIPNPVNTTPPTAPLTPPPDGAIPGQPTPVPEPAMPGLDARSYLVQSGDALSTVAARLGVSTWALLQENGLLGWGTLVVGQTLRIPEDSPGTLASTPTPEPPRTEPAPPQTEVAPTPDPTPTPEPAPPQTELLPTATSEQSLVTPTPEPVPQPEEAETGGDERTYTVQHGDTLTQIAARFGTTVAHVAQLNRIANPSQIYVGQVLRLAGTPPVVSGAGKLIVVSLSEQHLYAYQGDQLIYSFVASTGAAPSYTAPGEFRIQSKIPSAYGSAWDIWMPWWMGIYWAGSVENGIHALPVLPNGQILWAGYLGTPISFGCVVLGTEESKLLYDWAEIGTPVSIRY